MISPHWNVIVVGVVWCQNWPVTYPICHHLHHSSLSLECHHDLSPVWFKGVFTRMYGLLSFAAAKAAMTGASESAVCKQSSQHGKTHPSVHEQNAIQRRGAFCHGSSTVARQAIPIRVF